MRALLGHSSRAFFLVTALLAAACTPKAPPPVPPPPVPPNDTPAPKGAAAETPDAEFRKQAPTAGPARAFAPPVIEEAKLKNGVRVLFVPRHDLPIVAIQIVTDHGADQAKTGVAAFAMAGLLHGTKTRSAEQISDALDGLGADYGTSAGYDGCFLRAQVLSNKFGEALTVLADVWRNPTFPKDELEIERGKRLTWLKQEADSAGAQLSRATLLALYPEGHPYRIPVLGDEPAIRGITSQTLSAFHRAHLRPDRMIIAVAGDIEKGPLLEQLEKAFGDFQGKATAEVVPKAPAPQKGAKLILVDRPAATQTSLAFGLPGTVRKTPDFEAIVVMNTILGGQFTSRLNLNLRETHAYTYGARSGFDFRDGPGPFTAGGAMVREKTSEAIKEIVSEIERIRKTAVSDDELADAKSNLVRQLPSKFETAAETAGTLAALALYGLPLDELAQREGRIQKVSKEDVKRVAEVYLKADEMRIVLVGDGAVIKAGLSGLGMGDPEVSAPPLEAPKAGKAPPPAAGTSAPKATTKTETAKPKDAKPPTPPVRTKKP